jgi:carbon dioxide concentrating mechanism protein CcmN
MNLPRLELIDACHLYISGDVSVHPSAVLAPGVLLQADPGCSLVIAAGVCVGQGSILHAHDGTLEIAAGAILGSGVLVVGLGKIGSNACIGSLTTLINPAVDANQVIQPGSLLGDSSRPVELPVELPVAEPPRDKPDQPPSAPTPTPLSKKALTQVYGQAYLERIMITMFPHRQPLDQSADPDRSLDSSNRSSEGYNNANGSSPQPPP